MSDGESMSRTVLRSLQWLNNEYMDWDVNWYCNFMKIYLFIKMKEKNKVNPMKDLTFETEHCSTLFSSTSFLLPWPWEHLVTFPSNSALICERRSVRNFPISPILKTFAQNFLLFSLHGLFKTTLVEKWVEHM